MGKMKSKEFKKSLALILSSIAMMVAATASSMCFYWWYEEPSMPKSLYKQD
ncbi:hypothetical protein rsdtw13_23600 [Clostridium sp. TW13]|uniref:Uncharacterized protein n=1 Tax=Inconstantimicrobium mannanitabidum TaxID=1604901 RepID=A0ACB5RCU9_9CLOT|nr:hypothetical protein rsdtw13_23600 [Clostridium sp. TW13]